MKAKELMIGDWVMINPISYYQVEQIRMEFDELRIYLKGTEVFATENEIMPIPLTPEILEKNGFKLEEYSGSVMNGKWWTRNDFVINKNMNDSVGKNNFKYKYVHQLQHALRLCGISKEIEL